MADKFQKPEEEWREEMTPEQFYVMRQKGTERPFTGKYVNEKTPGMYHCAACEAELFGSDTKFDSGSGWPSFQAPSGPESVATKEDLSHGMRRMEVLCNRCGAHLGHVFPDGPGPGGMRYCINSICLNLKPEES